MKVIATSPIFTETTTFQCRIDTYNSLSHPVGMGISIQEEHEYNECQPSIAEKYTRYKMKKKMK